MLCAVEHGSSADLDKAAGGSPIVISASEFSHDKNHEELKRLSDQSVSVSEVTDGDVTKIQSASKDPPSQNDASKDENSFTFEVSPMADLPRRDSQKWRPFSNTEGGKASPVRLSCFP